MEWIETTGKTVEEAVQQALNLLGIDQEELEYEVVQEPKSGLLGIGSQRAHVRARVRPISREKPERRRGRGRPGGGRGGAAGRGRGRDRPKGQRERAEPAEPKGEEPRSPAARRQRSGADQGREGKRRRRDGGAEERSKERTMDEVPVEEQAEAAEEFVRGLVERFGLDADVTAAADGERVSIDIKNGDVGLLIGREGVTMEALRELVKTALQRQTAGHNARVSVDVGGYLARRREALERFARELAEQAIDSGRAQVLEPMSAPDRKVVHDAVNEIEGVTTSSEGEEPRRRVVIEPE